MKHGSWQNVLMSKNNSVPEVGSGATVLYWSDRQPATVIEIKKVGKKQLVTVREDNAKRIDNNGMSEMQEYEYTPNPNGRLYTFRLEKNGYVGVMLNPQTGRWRKVDGTSVIFGFREKYHDFSF